MVEDRFDLIVPRMTEGDGIRIPIPRRLLEKAVPEQPGCLLDPLLPLPCFGRNITGAEQEGHFEARRVSLHQ